MSQVNALEEEFDMSALVTASSQDLPTWFSSPPLMPELLQSLQETLGKEATPTAIQALSMKHLFKEPIEGEKYKEFLLASETGSGKSIAYLLPVLQGLKRTEHENFNTVASSRKPLNPRALVLAPMHELTRQLASFAKSLSHVVKLHVMCASKANTPSMAKASGTASKMKERFEEARAPSDAEFVISKSSHGSRPVDLLVGTPTKILEMERGRGWNWEERAQERERAMRIGKAKAKEREDVKKEDGANKEPPQEFWIDEPKMGLENVQWVVVDEADILFDPDFQQSTRMLLVDIAAACGQPVPVSS
ncbi:P-loop containing nucleoside triphosphate hydrolase protein [Suillus ampliporus]|nr:P-loop containing nucleoside triphosphate hydrolase protein [Suillus ampliporus]